MKTFFSSIFSQIKSWEKHYQYLFLSGITLLILSGLLFSFMIFRQEFGLLFSRLHPKDAQQIIQQLDAGEIPYLMRSGGEEIHIPVHLVEKTRINLLVKGLQFSGTTGFEIFDKSDFGMTQFSQKINLQRALQGELERTINSLDEVSESRVHLVLPENHIFQDTGKIPKAAITLHLRTRLNQAQIKGIQELVRASVPNLQKDQIVLLDNQGNVLTKKISSKTGYFSLKQKMEKYLTDKALDMLSLLYKKNQVIIRIDLSLNHDKKEQESIRPLPQIITHEKEIHHSTIAKKENLSSTEDRTLEKSYQPGSQKEHTVHASGNIQRMSISVLLPENTSPINKERIGELVKNATGFQVSRGDSIQVETLIPIQKVKKVPIPVLVNPSKEIYKPYEVTMPSFMEKRMLAIFFVGSAFLVFLLQRKKKRKKMVLKELSEWLKNHEH